jgi:hypothetical protein
MGGISRKNDDHPFKAGLGPLIDLQDPTIELIEPEAGDTLHGTVKFWGYAYDDYKVVSVHLKVTSVQYPGVNLYKEYYKVSLEEVGNGKWRWELEIDTLKFPTGEFKIMLKATDSATKFFETNDIIFFINNLPPVITVTVPEIIYDETMGAGRLGSPLLNYNITADKIPYNPPGYPRDIGKGQSLSGNIKDNEGIYTGAWEGGRYPPQIRLWQVEEGAAGGFDSTTGLYKFKPGYFPSTTEVEWHTFIKEEEIIAMPANNYMFFYKLPEVPGFYGFEIRAQNIDGRTEIRYPSYYYEPDTDWTDPANNLLQYAILYVKPQSETPLVELYGLEDIKKHWEDGSANYDFLKWPGTNEEMTDDEAHPYINNETVYKNGDFTLRIRASHSVGISNAAVYWQRLKGKNVEARGRFIWDSTNAEAHGNAPDTVTNPLYTKWGFGETNGDKTMLTYFFTYTHDGKAKVQTFDDKGDNYGWFIDKDANNDTRYHKLRKSNALSQSGYDSYWNDLSTPLPDGEYLIEIYAIGGDFSEMSKPFTCTIKIDTEKPKVEITRVEGADFTVKDGVYTVNGVVMPRTLFSENNTTDSGLRITSYDSGYFINGSLKSYEQLFIVVDETNKGTLESFLSANKNWWPVSKGTGLDMTVTGVTEKAADKILNNAFRVKTSPLYSFPVIDDSNADYSYTGNDKDALPDGNYWVYVFCRDNAFNVGHKTLPLLVKAETDIPVLDFNGSIQEVTDPNVSADGTDKGFIYQGRVRNKLQPGSSIRMTIRDDDGLDLDNVTVKFVKSTYSGPYTIVADDSKSVTLNSAAAKIFKEQQGVKSAVGEIQQQELVKAIKTAGFTGDYGLTDDSTSLADGMYKFTITIQDKADIKMKMQDTDSNPVSAVSDPKEFWIVIDTKGPEYQEPLPPDSAQPEEYIREKSIKGYVNDANGPIKITNWKVTDKNGDPADTWNSAGTYIDFGKNLTPDVPGGKTVTLEWDDSITGTWQGNFELKINMNLVDAGRYRFEITFEDRFGTTRTLIQYQQVDLERPKAVIRPLITTFERDFADVTVTGDVINKTRLANGVLNFGIASSDNIKVAEVKWWLMKGEQPLSGTLSGTGKETENDNFYNSNPSANTDIVAYGVLNTANGDTLNAMQFINSTLPAVPDGVYTLYVMAKDSAGNISRLYDPSATGQTAPWQTIYILQEQDKPYFYTEGGKPIAPNTAPGIKAVVGKAVITGEITDDDGFLGADGKVRPGSVKIWMRSGGAVPDENVLANPGSNGFGDPVEYGVGAFTSGVSHARKGVINLKVELETFNTFKNNVNGALDSDGLKYYIIEANDSNTEKYDMNGTKPGTTGTGSPNDTKTRRKWFSFIYDGNPPVIELEYPSSKPGAPQKSFGPNAKDNDFPLDNFHLEGSISDANLKTIQDPNDTLDPNYYYYFEYRLDNTPKPYSTFILKGNGVKFDTDGDGVYETSSLFVAPGDDPLTKVNFWIDASRFCDPSDPPGGGLDFDYGVSDNQNHTLTLFAYDLAYDQTGKEGKCSFNFIKDTMPPTAAVIDPVERKLPRIEFNDSTTTEMRDWWWDMAGLTNDEKQEWYKARRNWEQFNGTLYLKEYGSSGIPQLKVMFSDLTSRIDPTKSIGATTYNLKYWIDDEPNFRIAYATVKPNPAAVPPESPEPPGKTITYTINLTQAGSINPDGSITITDKPLDDGIHSIRFEIEDSVGNRLLSTTTGGSPQTNNGVTYDYNGNIYYGFRINSKLPTIKAVTPAIKVYGLETTNNNDTFFTINVTASGANLKEARLRIKKPDGTYYPGGTTWKPFDLVPNNGNWSYSGDKEPVPQTDPLTIPRIETLDWNLYPIKWEMLKDSLVVSGDYELELQAIGLDNRPSETVLWSFTIDNKEPYLKIEDLPPDAGDLLPDHWKLNPSADPPKKVFTNTTQRIQGLIKDDHSDLKNAQILIQQFDYATGAWKNYYIRTGDTTGSWGTGGSDIEWNELLDKDGNGDPIPAREKSINITLGSIQDITDGFYRVRLRARDSAWISGSTDISAEPWTPVPVNGHQVSSDYYYFFYASETPKITSFVGDQKLFSARASNDIKDIGGEEFGTVDFSGNATSSNGYDKLTVKVQKSGDPTDTTITVDWPPTAIYPDPQLPPPWSAPWLNFKASVLLPAAKEASGSYRLTFTVTDLAGRESTPVIRTITLDNKPPTGMFITPDLLPKSITEKDRGTATSPIKIYEFASETFYGGEGALITGSAEDNNNLKEIWYHLGYTGYVAPGTETAGKNVTAPTKKQIIQSVLGTSVDEDRGGEDNNRKFNSAALAFSQSDIYGSSKPGWFKYTNEAGYPQPDYIDSKTTITPFIKIPGDPLSLFMWRLEIPAVNNLANYANDKIKVKGYDYNDPGDTTIPTMAHRVDESDLTGAYIKNGLYSIPVWIRVADEAGNVEYFQRDIWVYPNGDYPTNVINNPMKDDSPDTEARAGIVSIDGIASDNVNIKNVIYRLWAQDQTNEWHLVKPSGATAFTGNGTQAGMWTVFRNDNGSGVVNSGSGQVTSITDSDGGWYMATVEDAAALKKSKSWDFYVNANNEFLKPIADWGFRKASGTGGNDTIKVKVEVLAFDSRADNNSYNLMSLSKSPLGTLARPDVVYFYISNTAPKIEDQQLSNADAFYNLSVTPATAAYSDYVNGRTRSGKFAIKMTLKGDGKNISKVQVRLPSEGNDLLSSWRDVWNTSTPGISFTATGSGVQTSVMTYAFDTTFVTSPASGFAPVMEGNWRESGGKYIIEVRLFDDNSPQGEVPFRFEVGIDNFAPIADQTKIISNTKVAGTNQPFQGRVYDYWGSREQPQPGYSSVEKIYVWFTKDQSGTSRYVSLVGYTDSDGKLKPLVTPSLTGSLASIPAYTGRTADGLDADPVTNITNVVKGSSAGRYYPDPTDPAGKDYVKVISEATQNSTTFLQPIDTGYSVLWSFIQNTTVLPDGPIYLNYIVVDGAGNASMYQQKMVVMNNYPIITDLTLYTNNTGRGAVYTSAASSSYKVDPSLMRKGYLNSGFIAKNNYIGFKVTTASGNSPLHYSVQHVTRADPLGDPLELTHANLLAIANDAAKPANSRTWSTIYTIADKGDMGDAVWAVLMGKPSVTATEGMNFAFKAAATDIGTKDYSAKVWRYTQVGALKKTPPDSSVSYADNVAVIDDAKTEDFRFSGTGEFAPGAAPVSNRISEYNGSHPDADDGNAGPTVTYNDPKKTAYFLIKVWDTVDPESANEDDQLYDAFVVGMNVYITDSNPPTSRLYDLNPYTEAEVVGSNIGDANLQRTINSAADPTAIGSNIVRGGLFNKSTDSELLVKSGYIDPRGQSKALAPRIKNSDGVWVTPSYPLKVAGDTVPALPSVVLDKVSGRVILRGVAWDDQLIRKIDIKIGNDNAKTIVQLKTTAPVDENDPNVEVPAAMTGLAFFAEQLHWKTGHVIEWAYVWNTETEPLSLNGGPGPVTVTVTVTDEKGPLPNATVTVAQENDDLTGTSVFHNTVSVDVVPYITGFQRDASKFSTKRSLQGWYSFYQEEPNISLLGYNFGANRGNAAISLFDNSTTYTLPNPSGYLTTAKPFRFNIPNNAKSGRLNVRVNNTTDAYNHSSNNTNSWNKEAYKDTPGSTLWINKPYAHVWRTTPQDTTSTPLTYIRGEVTTNAVDATSAGLDHPGMALEYTGTNAGRLHGTWTVYGNANVYWGTNAAGIGNALYNGDGNSVTQPPGEPFTAADISIYQGGGAGAANIGYTQLVDGRPMLFARAKVDGRITSQGINTSNTLMEPQKYGSNGRWQNIRLSKQAANSSDAEPNTGRLYMTAHDADYKGLWFGIAEDGTRNTMIIDGGRNENQQPTAAPSRITATGLTDLATSAGEFSAVDYDGTGPIIAYYDQQYDTVRVALGTGANPGLNNWSRSYLLPSGHALRRGSGRYISIKVEKNKSGKEGIHLAFYNSVYNKVVYYYAASRADIGSAPDGSTVIVHTVDEVIKGGTWTDVSVDNYGNPWIVYGDSSRTGNYDGIRVAYKSAPSDTGIQFTGALTCPVTKTDITGWEALTMPSNHTVNNDRLNLEVWPPTLRGGSLGTRPTGTANAWNAAVGYASDMFRVGYFYYPAWKEY